MLRVRSSQGQGSVCIGPLSSNVDRYWTAVQQHGSRSPRGPSPHKKVLDTKFGEQETSIWEEKPNDLLDMIMIHINVSSQLKVNMMQVLPPSSLDGQLWVELLLWIHVELESKLARLTKLVRKLQRMSSKQEKTSSQSPYILSPTQYSLPHPCNVNLPHPCQSQHSY